MIFISHSSKDSAAAIGLQQRLLQQGYDPSQLFLDSDAESGIPAGSKWEQELYKRLKDCRVLIVLYSANWQESKWCFAELVFAKAMGKEVFPVLLKECAVSLLLAEHQAVFVYRDGEAAYARLWAALENRHLGPADDFGWPQKDGDGCPFPGLLAFDERLAGVYFGREEETQIILENLRKMRTNREPRLLMIVGGSGSGKSSLLKAGVLPRLKHKTADTEWVVLPTLRYGESANEQHTVFDELAVNVAYLFPKDSQTAPNWKKFRDQLSNNDAKQAAKDFLDVLQDLTIARNCPDATVLIAIDQFEELLSPSAGPLAGNFLKFLKELLNCRNGRMLAIGTMRSDHLDIYERTTDALTPPFFQPWRLGPFPPERIEGVIRKPAGRAHVEITDELVDRLKHDTPSAEALPLLAFTLEKLYRGYASDGKLELHEYEALGGMEGSIQTCVKRIIPKDASPALISALRLSFVKHLAQANDKGDVVRLQARWDDLPAAAKPILEKFVNERLLIRSEHKDESNPEQRWVSVEVAHEAMFRCWDDLREWLSTSADILRWRRDVRRDQGNDPKDPKDPKWSGLRPAQLAVARDWPRTRRADLSEEEMAWINKGIFRERFRLAITTAVILFVTVVAGIAWWERNSAKQQARIALSRELAATASHERDSSELQVQLAREAVAVTFSVNKTYTAEAEEILRKAVPPESMTLTFGDTGFGSALEFSPDGNRLAAATPQLVKIWDTSSGDELLILPNRSKSSQSLAWSDNGARLISSEGDSTKVWDSHSGAELPTSRADEDLRGQAIRKWASRDYGDRPAPSFGRVFPSFGPVFSSDGKWLATNDNPSIRVLDAISGEQRCSLTMDVERVRIVSFSPDGKLLGTISGEIGESSTVQVWDLVATNLEPLAQFSLTDTVVRIAFSPDSKRVAIASEWRSRSHGLDQYFGRSSIKVMDVLSETNVFTLPDQTNAISFLEFCPDGKRLVTANAKNVHLWDAATGEDAGAVAGCYFVAFSPDGKKFASPDRDGIVNIGDNVGKQLATLRGQIGVVLQGVAFTSDRTRLATAGSDKRIRVWDLGSGRHVFSLISGHRGSVDTIAYSPDGRLLATGSEDEKAKIFDAASGSEIHTVAVGYNNNPVLSVAFSPDGKRIATGIYKKRAKIWDAVSGRELMTFTNTDDSTFGVAFSPDGARLVTSGAGHIEVWEIASGRQLCVAEARGLCWWVAFSPNGKQVATENAVWDSTSGNQLFAMPGGSSGIAFSPDSKRLATGSGKIAKVWDTASGKQLLALANNAEVVSLAFSLDGKYLVTVGKNWTVRYHPLEIEDLLALAHQRVPQELSAEEREHYLHTKSGK